MERLVKDSIDKGAKRCGARFDTNERYAAPTLLTRVRLDMEIMMDEIFGLVLPAISYDSVDEAQDFIRLRRNPLALCIFTMNRSAAWQLVPETASGSVCINDLIVQIENPNPPLQRTGSYYGVFGIRTFYHERSVVAQGPISLAGRLLSPP
jgi:aldehyde dehydrogenase (NAD+)